MQGLDYVCSEAFQRTVEADTTKWDKEWLRYLTLDKDYSFYFWDLSSERYILGHSKEKLRGYDREWWSTERLYKTVGAGVFVDGVDVVDKVVLEMGCGPGIFGRLATRFSKQYIGLDISQFALSIAKLASQPSAIYIHLSEVDRLKKLEKVADTCVGRHFLIHHNYEDCVWILSFLRDLTKSGGLISADFFANDATIDGHRRRTARDALCTTHASALYHFTDDDVRELAREVGLECTAVEHRPQLERRFALLRVP